MDQLPIPIQKIIWNDYVNPDFEDLITNDTAYDDFMGVYNLLIHVVNDDMNIMKCACKLGKITFMIKHNERLVIKIDNDEWLELLEIASKYKCQAVVEWILKLTAIGDESKNDANLTSKYPGWDRTYDEICYKNSCIARCIIIACENLHFDIVETIISYHRTNFSVEYFRSCLRCSMYNCKRSNAVHIKNKTEELSKKYSLL